MSILKKTVLYCTIVRTNWSDKLLQKAQSPINYPILQKLLLASPKKNYDKGDLIQSSDDKQKLSFVYSGFVKRYMISSDGSIGVQAIYGPGEIFPLTLAFRELLHQEIYRGPEVYYYQALTPCVIYSVDNDTLQAEAKLNPGLYKDMLKQAGNRLNSNIQKLENIAIKNSVKRVAHQLLYFAREYGTNSLFGVEIVVPLTQQDVADVLSLTRETVSQSFSTLRKKGLLTTDKNIVITNIDELEKLAFN